MFPRFVSLQSIEIRLYWSCGCLYQKVHHCDIFYWTNHIFTFWCFHGAIDSFPSSADNASTVDQLSCWFQAFNHLPNEDMHHFGDVDDSHSNCNFVLIFFPFQTVKWPWSDQFIVIRIQPLRWSGWLYQVLILKSLKAVAIWSLLYCICQ